MRDDGADSAGPQSIDGKFNIGRHLRSWLPQSLGGAQGTSPGGAPGYPQGMAPGPGPGAPRGSEERMSVDDTPVPAAKAMAAAWPAGTYDGTVTASGSRGTGSTLPNGADAPVSHPHGALLGQGGLRDPASLDYRASPADKRASLDAARAAQDRAPSQEASPQPAFDIPRKVRWPCVSSRCPPAMRDAEVAWSAARIRKLFQIGKGFMSEVYHAVDSASGTQVALKVYDKAKMHRRDVEQVEEEVAIHIHLTHPNILGLWAAFADEGHLYIVLELASGDDLYKRMSRIPVAEALVVKRFITPILAALDHCHSRGVLHRDLKPENVLLMEDGTCKLCDFGFSINTAIRRPVSRLGTLDFMAPEIVMAGRRHLDGVKDEVHNDADNYIAKGDRAPYSSAVDVWAVGGLLYELLVRTTPFASPSKNRTMRKIVAGDVALPDSLSPEAADFIRQCLRPAPADRPSCGLLLTHPLIAAHCPVLAQRARERLAREPSGACHVPLPPAAAGAPGPSGPPRVSRGHSLPAAARGPAGPGGDLPTAAAAPGALPGATPLQVHGGSTGGRDVPLSRTISAAPVASPGALTLGGAERPHVWGRPAARSVAPSEGGSTVHGVSDVQPSVNFLGATGVTGGQYLPAGTPGAGAGAGAPRPVTLQATTLLPEAGGVFDGSFAMGALGNSKFLGWSSPSGKQQQVAMLRRTNKRHSVDNPRLRAAGAPSGLHTLPEDGGAEWAPGSAGAALPMASPGTPGGPGPVADHRSVRRRSQDVPQCSLGGQGSTMPPLDPGPAAQ